MFDLESVHQLTGIGCLEDCEKDSGGKNMMIDEGYLHLGKGKLLIYANAVNNHMYSLLDFLSDL
jgi:hypothetical protein